MVTDFIRSNSRVLLDRCPDELAVKLTYLKKFRRVPNVRAPATFNEKIAWRKLYQHNPLFSVFADKVAVKDEIRKLVGARYVIDTLWVGDDPDGVPFERLAAPYVIKVSHSSGRPIFVRSGSAAHRIAIGDSLREQLRHSHARRFREWGYAAIPHRIIVERMLEIPGRNVPEDYKFFVYHGRVHFVQVDFDRFERHTRNIYDRDWNLLPVRYSYPANPRGIPKPRELPELLSLAERIGGLFDFVRVDLYATPSGIFFGEATFYPEAGNEGFEPRAWDRVFGEPWHLPERRPRS